MCEDEKWATNIAFVGNEKTVKKVLKKLNELEEKGEIEDLTGIEGPFDSLQVMLKRRAENLSLGIAYEVNTEPKAIETKTNESIAEEPEDDWFDDNDECPSDEEDDWFEEDEDDETI